MRYHGEVFDDGMEWPTVTSKDGLIQIYLTPGVTIEMGGWQAHELGRHLRAASETSQPSPVATRAETEAAPVSVVEAQGQLYCPLCKQPLDACCGLEDKG